MERRWRESGASGAAGSADKNPTQCRAVVDHQALTGREVRIRATQNTAASQASPHHTALVRALMVDAIGRFRGTIVMGSRALMVDAIGRFRGTIVMGSRALGTVSISAPSASG